jgi:ABC-type lipoprotein export system ATPase subunit
MSDLKEEDHLQRKPDEIPIPLSFVSQQEGQGGQQNQPDRSASVSQSLELDIFKRQLDVLQQTDSIPIELTPDVLNDQVRRSIAGDELPIVVEPDVQTPTLPPLQNRPGFPTQQPEIQVQHVTTDGVVKLYNFSFEIFINQLACIMSEGQEEAQSLLRLLIMMEKVVEGQVIIHGQNILQLTPADCHTFLSDTITYIRRNQLDLPGQTVQRHISHWLHYYKGWLRYNKGLSWADAQDAARSVLQSIKFPQDRWKASTQELTDEEIAQVSVAKATADSCYGSQSICLLDDVFTNLGQHDAQAQQIAVSLIQQLRRIAKRGRVVIVLANRQDLASFFDLVLQLRDGQLQVYSSA